MKKFMFFTAILFVLSASVNAEISVVVHPSNNAEITKDVVSQLFLGKTKNFPDGTSAVPIGQDVNSAATSAFNERVINRSPSQVKAYWSKQIFSGKGTPPKSVSSDEDVLELIANNPNLIGYVDSGKANDKVRVVLTL